MAIGGLDIGSTGAKITVLDSRGNVMHRGYRDYPISRSLGAHELHAEDIWQTVKLLLKDAAAVVEGLTAIGVTSFGESFVLLDEQGRELLPTMLYTDPHGGEEANTLRERIGGDRICAIAGCEPHPMYSLPKLMWVKTHCKESYAVAKYVCLIGDFLIFRLTGRRLIDYSLAARTMAFDIHNLCWSEEILAVAGVDPALLSTPVPTGTDAGNILPDLAAQLSLPRELRVVVCCHDQVAAAIGSNVLQPGQATDGAGTVECITPVFSPIPKGRALQESKYAVIPFLDKDTYCLYAFSYTGGALVSWFIHTLARHEKAEAQAQGASVYDLLECGMRDEPTGILVLPHFAGAATPYMDTGSKGAFVGLDLAHTVSDLYRAVLEGIVFEMAINIERLTACGLPVVMLNATGGGAKSHLWLQMKADILNVPVQRMSVDDAGTVGGIMLTGVATGAYESLVEAAEALVRPIEVFHPRAEMHARYMEVYARYRRLYDAVRPLA